MACGKGRAERKRLAVKYSACYLPFKPPGHWRNGSCCYCANPANNRDHIPPLVWVQAMGLSWFEDRRIPLVWVPACAECNHLLGAERLFTIAERTSWLLKRYAERYRELLASPRWNQGEINELTGRTKRAIQDWATVRAGLGRRLAILGENEAVRHLPQDVQADS